MTIIKLNATNNHKDIGEETKFSYSKILPRLQKNFSSNGHYGLCISGGWEERL